MRVLLDVGAHVGDTVRVALEQRWQFDQVWAFEPTTVCLDRLREITDPRLTVVDAGWWSSDETIDIHDPGTLHASVLPEASREDRVERCQLVDAAAWMAAYIDEDDVVWVKMNIEAAEIEALRRLLETGEIRKVDHLVVHFDSEKYGGHGDARDVREQLDASGIEWRDAGRVMFGRDDASKMHSWLAWTMGDRFDFERRRLEHRARAAVWRARNRVGLRPRPSSSRSR